MSKEIRVVLDDDEYEYLSRVKGWNNKTWREIVHLGVETLDDPTKNSEQ